MFTNKRIKMRAVLFFVAVTQIVYIYAEDCPTNNVHTDCTHLQCTSEYHRECVNHVCTCNPNQGSYCTHTVNCTSNVYLPACWLGWHCVNQGCRCGGSFGK
ncbi:serine protease inhibitor Cvsi-2-like [Mercenaria mercenaria]|uniref:serine protease inhibitor Cvsi-2-like n=1 Tax=Mercenaria mercenaria TaxID=6596 RepID=UPI00234F4AFB|nr:serine protease inhibitor Cvsi-2-like [Mercenaria mercenaria]